MGISVFIPMYNCGPQIGRVVLSLAPVQHLFSDMLIVDNGSTDESLAAAEEALKNHITIPSLLVQNERNYSLGGSHKVAFGLAGEKGSEFVLVIHGDDQADINDAVPLIESGTHAKFDMLLGARFHPDSALLGYSFIRALGNRVLNFLASIAFRGRIYDTGAGLNIYGKRVYANRAYEALPNDLTFGTALMLEGIRHGWRFDFFPMRWREEDQVSNAKVVRQGLKILKMMLRHVLGMKRLLPAIAPQAYPYRVIYQSPAR